jgi:hypothetical protein
MVHPAAFNFKAPPADFFKANPAEKKRNASVETVEDTEDFRVEPAAKPAKPVEAKKRTQSPAKRANVANVVNVRDVMEDVRVLPLARPLAPLTAEQFRALEIEAETRDLTPEEVAAATEFVTRPAPAPRERLTDRILREASARAASVARETSPEPAYVELPPLTADQANVMAMISRQRTLDPAEDAALREFVAQQQMAQQQMAQHHQHMAPQQHAARAGTPGAIQLLVPVPRGSRAPSMMMPLEEVTPAAMTAAAAALNSICCRGPKNTCKNKVTEVNKVRDTSKNGCHQHFAHPLLTTEQQKIALVTERAATVQCDNLTDDGKGPQCSKPAIGDLVPLADGTFRACCTTHKNMIAKGKVPSRADGLGAVNPTCIARMGSGARQNVKCGCKAKNRILATRDEGQGPIERVIGYLCGNHCRTAKSVNEFLKGLMAANPEELLNATLRVIKAE